MQFEHVFLIGTGGIGSNLVEPLVRMLAYHDNGTKNVTVVDGDEYEEKNQTRQLFDSRFVGANKAKATAERIGEALVPIQAHEEYLNKDKTIDLLYKNLNDSKRPFMVITAVDNHATRKAVIEALDEAEFPNFVFLSGGNGYDRGQVMTYAKIRGEAGTVHPFDKYDDLKYPTDHIPGEPGCQDEAVSEPQLITANAAAALGLLWTVQAMLDDGDWFEELHFDSVRMKLMPQGGSIKFPSLEEKTETETEKAEDKNSENEAVLEVDASDKPAEPKETASAETATES